MGIFSSIKDAIFGKAEAKAAPAPAPRAAPAPGAPAVKPTNLDKPVAPLVDIESVLDARLGADKLNWRTSIVDLMKLVGTDASYAERKELAEEFGNTSYEGSADDNILLHKQLMKQLQAHGGKVPANLVD
ncbi:MAG: DUF3597 domain-containing protein [Pseudomonadota bacterium]